MKYERFKNWSYIYAYHSLFFRPIRWWKISRCILLSISSCISRGLTVGWRSSYYLYSIVYIICYPSWGSFNLKDINNYKNQISNMFLITYVLLMNHFFRNVGLPPLLLLESTFLKDEKYTSKSWRVIGGWGLDAPRMPDNIELEI